MQFDIGGLFRLLEERFGRFGRVSGNILLLLGGLAFAVLTGNVIWDNLLEPITKLINEFVATRNISILGVVVVLSPTLVAVSGSWMIYQLYMTNRSHKLWLQERRENARQQQEVEKSFLYTLE